MFLKFKQKIQEIIRITHPFFITILKGIQFLKSELLEEFQEGKQWMPHKNFPLDLMRNLSQSPAPMQVSSGHSLVMFTLSLSGHESSFTLHVKVH